MKSLMISSVTVLVLWWCESVNAAVMFGQVQSPRYPNPYPADQYQQWDLDVPPGYHIQLTFTYMDIESSADCFYDYLQVLHGKKVLGRFCGQNYTDPYHPGNRPISSPDNRLQLVFVTDDSNPDPQQPIGFSAFYQAVDVDECSSPVLEDAGPICSHICLNTLGSYLCACHHGYHLKADRHTCVLDCGSGTSTESEGTLTSPGYPSSSPLALDCMYNISVEPGFEITLNFSNYFHIEQIYNQGPTCLYHWLLVSIPGEKPRKFCGDKSPGILHTGSSSVQLEYHTDNMGQSRGWSLHYSTQRVECKIRSIINGRVTPDFPKYFYRDYIHVRCDLGHKLMLAGKEIASFRSMCQQNGRWHLPLPECMIIDCGAPIPLLNGGVNFLSGSNNEYLAVIQYHCNKPFYSFRDAHYVNFTCASNRKWMSSDDNAVIPPCDPVCGRPTVELFSRDRVFGGKEAPAGSFPWQAFVRAPGQRGGAFVIGDRWLLTAAHILENNDRENMQVYVGNNKITELIHSPPLAIASVHIHPGYKNNVDRTNFDNDIALMKLNSSITFNADVMPVCIPPHGSELNPAGWVSGFGSTEDWSSANTLRYISLPLVDQNACHTWLEKERSARTDVAPLTANMFCAGYPEGIKDTCSGDSGSAFVMRKDEYYWAAGIVSWGVDCGKPGKYGMYTRVTQYVDWIQKTMEELGG